MNNLWVIVFLARYFKKYRVILYMRLLESLEIARENFNKATVRYTDNVKFINKIINAKDVDMSVVSNLFNEETITVRSSSSRNALEITEYLLGDGLSKPPPNFKLDKVNLKMKFLDWFSNRESVNLYLSNGRDLIRLCCIVYSDSNTPLDFTKLGDNEIPQHLYLYLTGKDFRSFLNDYLEIYTIVLIKELEAIR